MISPLGPSSGGQHTFAVMVKSAVPRSGVWLAGTSIHEPLPGKSAWSVTVAFPRRTTGAEGCRAFAGELRSGQRAAGGALSDCASAALGSSGSAAVRVRSSIQKTPAGKWRWCGPRSWESSNGCGFNRGTADFPGTRVWELGATGGGIRHFFAGRERLQSQRCCRWLRTRGFLPVPAVADEHW